MTGNVTLTPVTLRSYPALGFIKVYSMRLCIRCVISHHNRTFAAGYQSISGERLYEERQVETHYRDAVRKYLSVLKSCVSTSRDEPGLLYEAMFRPDQEVDTGLFDIEEERIRELRKNGI